jgi:hypothetical protein
LATTQDASIGLAVESAYGTYATPTRFIEFTTETLDWAKSVKQGAGLRVGSRVARSGRRVVASAAGTGDITLECNSKGMGLLWQACLGTGASTLVSGTTYQQVFTLGDNPPSLTVQKGLPQVGGTVDPYTFVGSMVSQYTFTFPNADICTLQAALDLGDLKTATPYAAPSYPTGGSLFHFAGGSISSGTLTAPTATALASGTTPIADVRSGTVVVNNNLTIDRYNFGGKGRKSQPTVGLRQITGTLVVEYDSTTWRDAVMTDTPMSLVLNFTTPTALSSGVETLQIVLPEVKFDSPMPQTNATSLITTTLAFTALDNLTAAQPIWVVTRTSDAAL